MVHFETPDLSRKNVGIEKKSIKSCKIGIVGMSRYLVCYLTPPDHENICRAKKNGANSYTAGAIPLSVKLLLLTVVKVVPMAVRQGDVLDFLSLR